MKLLTLPHFIAVLLTILLLAFLAVLTAKGEVHTVGTERVCTAQAIENPAKTVWVVHRFKRINGIETDREAIFITMNRKRALKACEAYLDGKPAIKIKGEIK
jgi:hypothetical protein